MPERLTLAAHAPADHAAWLARFPGVGERDIYPLQVAELAEVRLPGGPAAARAVFAAEYAARDPGAWSCYPWLNTVLRTLGPDALYELRTNRNRNLVTTAEQSALRPAHIAIAGLSVGANIVSALAHHGIGGTFSLADRDEPLLLDAVIAPTGAFKPYLPPAALPPPVTHPFVHARWRHPPPPLLRGLAASPLPPR